MKVLFYPKQPTKDHKVAIYLNHLGVPYTKDINDKDITIAFHWDHKNSNELSPEMLEVKDRGIRVINERCTNIKKDYLDDKFTQIFGYSLRVDPTTHHGTCLRRSTQQAIHAAKLIQCPIPPWKVETGMFRTGTGEMHSRLYCRFIDTRFELDKLRDVRIPIFNGKIPMVFIKELDIKSAFHPHKENYYHVYTDYDISRWLTEEEVDNIALLSYSMGLECGEFDFLRDNSTGLGYVCDINNLAMGDLFRKTDNKEEVIADLSQVFKKELLSK